MKIVGVNKKLSAKNQFLPPMGGHLPVATREQKRNLKIGTDQSYYFRVN